MYFLTNERIMQEVTNFFYINEQVYTIDSFPMRLIAQNQKDPFCLNIAQKYSVKSVTLDQGFNMIFVHGVESSDFYKMLYNTHKDKLVANAELKRVLNFSIESPNIFSSVIENLTDIGNYYELTQTKDNVPVVRYVPTSKFHRIIDLHEDVKKANSLQRNLTSVIKFALDREKIELTDSDVEYIANRMKQYFMDNKVEVVEIKGKEIKDAYLLNNYSQEHDLGDLANSCMRYDQCQYWLNLYTENPDKISMLVLKQRGRGIIGRALVWTLNNGERALDRVYGSQPTQNLITEYANEQGIRSKKYLLTNGIVTLENYEFESYPFLDTLFYAHAPTKTLYTEKTLSKINNYDEWRYHRNAHGTWSRV